MPTKTITTPAPTAPVVTEYERNARRIKARKAYLAVYVQVTTADVSKAPRHGHVIHNSGGVVVGFLPLGSKPRGTIESVLRGVRDFGSGGGLAITTAEYRRLVADEAGRVASEQA